MPYRRTFSFKRAQDRQAAGAERRRHLHQRQQHHQHAEVGRIHAADAASLTKVDRTELLKLQGDQELATIGAHMQAIVAEAVPSEPYCSLDRSSEAARCSSPSMANPKAYSLRSRL